MTDSSDKGDDPYAYWTSYKEANKILNFRKEDKI